MINMYYPVAQNADVTAEGLRPMRVRYRKYS